MKTNKKYFIKLTNGEKLELTKDTFDIWLHDAAGNYIVVKTGNNSELYIKRSAIIFGYTLDLNTKFDDTLNKK